MQQQTLAIKVGWNMMLKLASWQLLNHLLGNTLGNLQYVETLVPESPLLVVVW
jgi:hypothetical protein